MSIVNTMGLVTRFELDGGVLKLVDDSDGGSWVSATLHGHEGIDGTIQGAVMDVYEKIDAQRTQHELKLLTSIDNES